MVGAIIGVVFAVGIPFLVSFIVDQVLCIAQLLLVFADSFNRAVNWFLLPIFRFILLFIISVGLFINDSN